MPASSRPSLPRRRRRLLLPSLAGAGVLAGMLSTLAGGAAGLPGLASQAAASGRPAATAPALAQPPVAQATVGAGPGQAAMAAAAAQAIDTARRPGPARGLLPADPHPYAPGGDDLLPAGDAPAGTAPPLPRQAVAAPSAPAQAAPLLWLAHPRVALGDGVVLHAAAADGLRCQGRGALIDGLPVSGGRLLLRASAAGQHRLKVVCIGPAGPVEATVMLTVPLPVAAHSADNQRGLDAQTAPLPGLAPLGLSPLPGTHPGAALLALGDFLQQGRQSLFAVAAGADGRPRAYLMARDAAGRWADHSADLLDDADRAACAAVQLLSTDFNRDGRPDVWLACPGRQLLFLSQADGRYQRIETPFALHPLLAEARDVDGDGWADIVTLDRSGGMPRTLLLLGRGDGRFEPGPAAAWGLDLGAQRR